MTVVHSIDVKIGWAMIAPACPSVRAVGDRFDRPADCPEPVPQFVVCGIQMIRAKRLCTVGRVRLRRAQGAATAHQRIPLIGPGRTKLRVIMGRITTSQHPAAQRLAINLHLCAKDIAGIIQILPADAAQKHPVGHQIPGTSLLKHMPVQAL